MGGDKQPGLSRHPGDAAEDAVRQADAHRILVRARALLAMAESSEFSAEARAFAAKAAAMADDYGIEPALLVLPREPLRVALVVSELQRLRDELEAFAGDGDLWATKTAEWSACLDEYDLVLEAAADLVQVVVPRLPYGSKRHFRPDERTHIEALLRTKVSLTA